MKRFIQISIAAVIGIALAACDNKVDPRDAYVGVYNYEAVGTVVFNAAIVTLTVPLDESGTMTITKQGNEDKVLIEGFHDPIQATVSGDKLVLEAGTYTMEQSGIIYEMVLNHGNATLNEKQLSWNIDIQGTARYNSITVPGNGSAVVTATKQ